jgi:hypothetical protein
MLTLILRYTVVYSANRFPPRIWLTGGDGRPLRQQLVFMPNGASLPPDDSKTLYYHLEDFPNVLDLLRNEKPVYLHFLGEGGGFENGIRTGQEPVGEGEQSP